MILRESVQVEETRNACEYEILFSDYNIQEGELKPKFPLNEGATYLNFTLFKDNFTYIKTRAEKSQNPKYKAKYYQLLWQGPLRHNEFGKQAIKEYFRFLDLVVLPENDTQAHIVFESYLKNVFVLAQNLKYKTSEAFGRIDAAISSRLLHPFRKSVLIEFVLKSAKKIADQALETYRRFCENYCEQNPNSGFTDRFWELLIALAPRLQISPKSYFEKLGDYYSDLGKKKENFVAHHFYIKALNAYQKAAAREKVESTTELIEISKNSLEFKTVRVENSSEELQKWWKIIRKMTDTLTMDYSSREIYEYLILCEHLFPKAAVLTDNAMPDMVHFMNLMTFDLNKNLNAKIPAGFNGYELHIKTFTLKHLQQVFIKGMSNGKITSDTLLAYLKEFSWYGMTDNESGFNWIELMEPSIRSFFQQSEDDIRNNTNSEQGYILCVDSLALKFEGLLRDFSRKLGAQTIEIKEGGTEERISFEKLLENQKLKDCIPEDDIALFKFLFTARHMNLRNNIAHCFFKTSQYSAGLMFLLIPALLKLGIYTFEK